jgi:hypothetical protein
MARAERKERELIVKLQWLKMVVPDEREGLQSKQLFELEVLA